MDVESVREYCISKKGVTESFPFDDTSLVLKVMGKMFLLMDLERADKISLKCDPDYAVELREKYDGIEPAYHFNKKHWNQLFFSRVPDDRLIKSLIDHSYEEVIRKFPRKLRNEYDMLE